MNDGAELTGKKYLRMVWGQWVFSLVAAIFVVVALGTTWIEDVVLGALLVFWAQTNLTSARRVAARIDERHR